MSWLRRFILVVAFVMILGLSPAAWAEAGAADGSAPVGGVDSPAGNWSDDFDAYPTGANLHGMGGWKGYGNDPNLTAYTTDVQARSAPNSVDTTGNADLVHEYSATSGFYTFTTWQYIPGNMVGTQYFIMLNQYDDSLASNNWSVQVSFNSATGMMNDEGATGATQPYIADQWVEIRLEIDLDQDTQAFFYNGVVFYTGTWSQHVSGGGITAIGAVDLFANGASSVYYDDMSLTGPPAAPCTPPEDIPWVSLSTTSGWTSPGETDTVLVYYDSTGLTADTYNAALCVHSNDPDPGPGNGTRLVIVPLELQVEQPTDVGLSGFSGGEATTQTGMTVFLCAAAVALGFAGIARRRRAH